MSLILNDRVRETSVTTGTGTLTLAGAVTGFQSFSDGIGNTNTTYYAIQGLDADGALTGEWEVGIGTVSAGALARTTVLESSNADAAVNFTSASLDVYCTIPAARVKTRKSLPASAPLAIVDSHKVYDNTGATALVIVDLPAASPDLEFTFLVTDADGIKIDAAGSDTIRNEGSVSSAGGTATCTQMGGAIHLYGTTTGWIAISSKRTWALA